MTNSERNAAFELFLAAAAMKAETMGGDVLGAAQALLDTETAAKAERDMMPYERGDRDAAQGRGCCPRIYYSEPDDITAYCDGYMDREQVMADEVVDVIERDYLDGECSLSGHYYA